MTLWFEWYRCVRQLRESCSRLRSFLWMVVVLVGFCTRPELAGITSIVRTLDLVPGAYDRLLYVFRSTAINVELLTAIWSKLTLRIFRPLTVGSYLVCLADGIKVAKEGRKMPAVRSLHQSSDSNSKAPYIMGHSFEALSLLTRSRAGHVASIPLTARIHEGLTWSNRDQRTLLDKMVVLFLSIAEHLQHKALVIADAYYASRKVVVPLLHSGHHLLTRVRINTVAYRPAPTPKVRRRGRPRLYGDKLRLKELARDDRSFELAPSPIPGEPDVQLEYCSIDLLWRPIGKLVRFVIVRHPVRGTIFLMTTLTDLAPLDVLLLYSHRFKIEVGFRQAVHVLGSYAYHFWMKTMTPIRRRSADQYLHMKSDAYRHQVRRKMNAYHLHVQLGCIAQGLLLHLAINHGPTVWHRFRSWLRTMDPSRPPSELVVAHALRHDLPEFLADPAGDVNLEKLFRQYSRELDPALSAIPA